MKQHAIITYTKPQLQYKTFTYLTFINNINVLQKYEWLCTHSGDTLN